MQPKDHLQFRDTGSHWTLLRVSTVEPALLCKQGHPPKWGGRTDWFYTDQMTLVDGD